MDANTGEIGDTLNVREGMRVVSSDGEELGTVEQVWPETRGEVIESSSVDTGEGLGTGIARGDGTEIGGIMHGSAMPGFDAGPTLGMESASTDLPSGGQPIRSAGGGYFKVGGGGGFLGIGGGDLYVPLHAVGSITDEGVQLNIPAAVVDSQGWGNKPVDLD